MVSRDLKQAVSGVREPAKAEPKSWRCFHCDDFFTDQQLAAEHFGTDWFCEDEGPSCIQILTEGEKAIVNERREACRLLRETEAKLEQAEDDLSAREWEIRGHWPKLRTINDVWHEYDFIEGRMLAAEDALRAAPRWLSAWLRRRAERHPNPAFATRRSGLETVLGAATASPARSHGTGPGNAPKDPA